VYRLALFTADIGAQDVPVLTKGRRTVALSDQLHRALGSISANIAEGYSPGTAKERARFCEYALDSARESRDWSFEVRHILPSATTTQRLDLPTRVIRLLLVMVPNQRGQVLKEEREGYDT
jgi:four helix bundle protein